MKSAIPAAVVLVAFLAGCGSGSDERAPMHGTDGDRESLTVTEERVAQDSRAAVEAAPPSERSRREEHSWLLTFLISWSWYYAIGLIIGTLIYRDASGRKELAMNIRPIWWLLLAIFDAPLGLLTYWVMNYSNLAAKPASQTPSVND